MDLSYAQERKVIALHPQGCLHCDGNDGSGWEFEHIVRHPMMENEGSTPPPNDPDAVVILKLTCRSCGVTKEVTTPWEELRGV
jgi:hypothetical protein